MHRPYLSVLNTDTNTPFDFSKVMWTCTAHDFGYLVRGEVQIEGFTITGVDCIEKTTWDIMTQRGKELTLRASVLIAASNLVSHWREQES